MREILTAAAGGAASILTLLVSRATSGDTQALFFLLSILIGTVTVGLVVAAVVDRLLDRQRTRPESGRSSSTATTLPGTCRSCRSPMVQIDLIWICGSCDRVPIQS